MALPLDLRDYKAPRFDYVGWFLKHWVWFVIVIYLGLVYFK